MERDELKHILEKQRAFFATGATLDPDYRTEALYNLRKTVLDCQGEIAAALREDLGKSEMAIQKREKTHAAGAVRGEELRASGAAG